MSVVKEWRASIFFERKCAAALARAGMFFRCFHALMLLPLLWLVLPLAGCSCRLNAPSAANRLQTREPMTLHNHPLELRLFKPPHIQGGSVLIVYATGDGGWNGLGGEIFDWLTQWNYAVAGFSSKEYLEDLGYVSETDTTTPRRLVQDYRQIIDFAESRLALPASTPLILVGLSRGAGLSVVAAGEGELNQHLAGLLAVALTKEEEHVLHRTRAPRSAGDPPRRERVEIQTYSYLNRLTSFPVMVVQSTHDRYLTAEAARKLFGPDTELRRLRAVEAANHSFWHGCRPLYAEAESALKWMTTRLGVGSK